MWTPWRALLRRRRPDADFSAEIAAHLALETERLIADGVAPDEAGHLARRRFGNIGAAQETFHRRQGIGWIEAVERQIRRAVRRLAITPAFTVSAILTLALGLGATTAVFSLVEGVLLRPLPYRDPAQLTDVSHTMQLQGISTVDQSDATYLYYRRANHVFSAMGAYAPVAVNLSSSGSVAGSAAPAERVDATRATASLFGVLGVTPMRGRFFRADEDLPGAAPVVILSERLWKTRFASDPQIIGRVLNVNGIAHTVVGVMPSRFAFPTDQTALWLPIGIDPANTKSAAFDFKAIGRLRPGVTISAATADLDRLLPHVPEAFPGRLTTDAIGLIHMHPLVHELRDTVIGTIGRSLWVVLGAAAFLLLIACANVANLFLVRAEERQHDISVRRALGAGRGAIVAEFFTEGLLLAVVGGLLGLALAKGGVSALRATRDAIAIPRLGEVGLDGRVLAVAAAATLFAALLMSILPALRSSRADVANALAQTGRGLTAGRTRHRARRLFVVIQMALALVLVAGAGLMARSYAALRAVTPGFDTERSYTFRVALPTAEYPTTASALSLVTRAIDKLSALPGVAAAGVITKLPLDATARQDTAVFVADKPPAMGQMPNVHQVSYVSPEAFAALGIRLIHGHTFQRLDPTRVEQDVIVTHALARRYWTDGTAVGKRLQLAPDGPVFNVIGVTGDIRGTGLDAPPDETVFVPLVAAPGAAMADGSPDTVRWMPRQLAFIARSSSPSHDITAAVQRAFKTVAPDLPVYAVRSMRAVVAHSTARTAFTLELLEIASIAALLIGAIGLYGVVSYMVSLRARDTALRLALGAEPAALRRRVLYQVVGIAAIGVVLGVGAAIVLTRFLSALLFGVQPTDPATLIGAAILMTMVALVASWFPARRAARVDPATVLRTEV